VDPNVVVFGVITRVPAPETGGNLAADLDVFSVGAGNGIEEVITRVPPLHALNLRTPVFHVGEVVIMDASGREIPFPQRKPSKWDVDCEQYTDLGQALGRAREVLP